MSAPIRCFLLTDTNFYCLSLRRYRSDWREDVPKNPCPLPQSYHDVSVILEPKLELAEQPASGDDTTNFPHSDPRWPSKCACGYTFEEGDQWQVNYSSLYKRSDNGELVTLRDAPVGALWDAHWMPECMKRPDGRYMICRTPGGEWAIDSKCSNCTRPNEPHDCWVRHGEPPDLHVDKNGNTCSAGAGSIICGGWHGFLHNGNLVQC
jgi:hypothetical protein